MAKHITNYQIKSVMDVINRWSEKEKLTWDALCDKLLSVIGKRPTRQSLSSYSLIAECFNNKKEKIKQGEEKIIKPSSMKVAAQRIKRLEAENQSLAVINAKFLEQFIRWQYNAFLKNITPEELDSPLPKKY